MRAPRSAGYKAVYTLKILAIASYPAPRRLTTPLFKAVTSVPSDPSSSCPQWQHRALVQLSKLRNQHDMGLLTQPRASFRLPDRCPFSVLGPRAGRHERFTCRVSSSSPVCASFSGFPSFLTLTLVKSIGHVFCRMPLHLGSGLMFSHG